MSEPIKAGDLCEVIDGLLGKDSPNIGLYVTVLQYVGDHPKYGRMWRCEAEYGEVGAPAFSTDDKIPPGVMDFAQSWLRKLPPKPQAPAQKVIDRELEKVE